MKKTKLKIIKGTEYLKKEKGRRFSYAKYQCTCGSVVDRRISYVKSSKVKSCGCLIFSPDYLLINGTPRWLSSTYNIWRSMISRCNNPKRKDYYRYGGNGIKVCKKWLSFDKFYSDMGQRPYGLTLDRIDNNKGYSPQNCRWTTAAEQARNKKNNIFIEYNGEKLFLPDIAKKFNIARTTIYYRYHNGLRMPELVHESRNKKK